MTKKKIGLPPWKYEERIPTDDFEEIIYEKDGPIGRLILNGPEKRNPLSYARICELAMGLHEMDMDPDIRVVIIKGAGSAFCSGYDLTPGKAQANNPNPDDYRKSIAWADVGDPPGGVYYDPKKDHPTFAKYEFFARELYFRIFDLHKPVIAQVHGYCLAGGTHLAGFCDLRIVAEDAQIGFPTIRQLTIEGYQYEVWLMGASRAKHFLFTGDPMDGRKAYDWGWASDVHPADRLDEETDKLARSIAKTDPVLLMSTKAAVNRQLELQGFRTGMRWSMDVHSAGVRGSYGSNADEFWKRSAEGGLRSAVDWRDDHFGIEYPAGDATQ
ncbi:enoyl-CoA hydratase-related protein [Pseudofrankia inefficax]|uniref:Enoyl-CoA hydratase/isomerase n=1 Tax=Pseudofrankia inefficax (strain DSM 45817 / CECT 9037 / DDB 130130 / EuI1c) TaxID=298654 RepID=E3J8Z5_PSEI1|nr:enoyl-CoA hydratase-related protein [Pseudofrankia inefficax]ADP80874.1 Enoyl-CoA hydratase/isomerase [Pseudofrankia inefficax]